MKLDTEQTMKLEYLYKVGSEWELNSWPDSQVGSSIWMEFSGRGFKSYSGQLSTDLDLELKRVYPKNYENKRLQLNQKHQKFQQNLDKHCLKKWNNIKQKEILSIDFNTTEKFDIEKKEVQEHSKFICKNLQNVTDNRHYRKKQSKLYTDVVKSTDSSVEEAPESGKTIN